MEEILIENDKVIGVKLADGKIIKVRQAVVSNADPCITNKLLSNARKEGKINDRANAYMDALVNTDESTGGIPDLKRCIYIHAGIDASDLPTNAGADFPAQWAVVRD